jgi:hypothetical protein
MFEDYIPQAFPYGTDLILDSEVLLIDVKSGKPLPFGSLGKHKVISKSCMFEQELLVIVQNSLHSFLKHWCFRISGSCSLSSFCELDASFRFVGLFFPQVKKKDVPAQVH